MGELADKVFYNGKVVTMEKEGETFSALAIKDGKIIALGSDEEIKEYLPETNEVIDLQGKTVLPGFIDSHVHFTQTGLGLLAVNLAGTKSIAEVQDLMKEAVAKAKPGEFVRGIGIDDTNLVENRLPTRDDLDEFSPNNPIWICRIDSHSSILNTCALEKIGQFEYSGADRFPDGRLTGVMRGEANSVVRGIIADWIDDNYRGEALYSAAMYAAERGVTMLNALEGGPLFSDRDVDVLVAHQDKLPIEVVLFFQTFDVEKAKELGLKRVGGCIVLDGSAGSWTAAISEPYADNPTTNGILYYSQETINAFVEKAHRAGMQISFHALGDRAIDQVLTAYERAQSLYPREDVRHRIEHFEIPSMDNLKKVRELHVIPSVQPAFDFYWGNGMYVTRLGKERASKMNPFKTCVDMGILLAGGSDSDVTEINPLFGVYAATHHSNPEQSISVYEALKMFTINGAYAVYQENDIGSIRVGKRANLVILDKNPLEVDPDTLRDIEVIQTIVKGEVVFEK